MYVRVERGALAFSRHVTDTVGAVCSLWSRAWLRARAGQGVAVDGQLPPGHGERAWRWLLLASHGRPAMGVLGWLGTSARVDF